MIYFRYIFEVAGKDITDNCISGHFQPRHKSKNYGQNLSWPIGKSIHSEHLTSTTVDGQVVHRIAVNMDRKKCGTFSSSRRLSPDIYHINILRNPNEMDVHLGRNAKPKYTYFFNNK